jgi:phage-related protein
MWWNTSTNKLNRYKYAGGVYSWEEITDKTATDAYANASTAQDTADRKRQVFVSQPTPPYDVGDLWDRGPTTGIYRCATAKAAGQSYAGGDWQVVADLTGNNEAASISNQGNFATLDQITLDNVSTYIASGAIGNAYIGNVIQSSNYNATNKTGWKIDKSGAMDMNNATFRGTLDVGGSSGNRLNITSDKIEVWEGTTLRVRLGKLS